MRFVSPLLQATGRGEGEPAIQIKWLNSPECYVLSTWRMLSWFVLISEYKSTGNKTRRESRGFPCLRLCAEWPDHSDVCCCMTCFLLFLCNDKSLTSSSWSVHADFSVKQVIDILFFPPFWGSLNDLRAKSPAHQKWPSAAVRRNSHYHLPANPLPDKSSMEMRTHYFLYPSSPSVTADSQ